MSDIVPARIQAILQVGSADISAMMVQAYFEGLQKEEETLLASNKAIHGEMEVVYEDIRQRFAKAFEKKRDTIEPLVASLNALLGGKRRVVARLHPSMSYKSDMAGWFLFSRYLPDRHYGGSPSPFNQTTFKSSWVLVFEDTPEDVDCRVDDDVDESISFTVNSEHVGGEKLQRLSVDIPKALRERINDILSRFHSIGVQLDKVRMERKDIPNIERKVSAALTKQLIQSQPDLMRQVNAAFAASSGKLLLEVQDVPPAP